MPSETAVELLRQVFGGRLPRRLELLRTQPQGLSEGECEPLVFEVPAPVLHHPLPFPPSPPPATPPAAQTAE